MTRIDLYQVFREIPNVTEEQAKQAAASVAQAEQVATKTDISKLEAKMLKTAIGIVVVNVTLTVGLLKLL